MSFNNVRFTVAIANMVGNAPVTASAMLTVLSDMDRDGLPDVWETNHPGFSTTDPNDAARDDDGDGMSNAAEIFAGTDYLDAESYLKLEISAAQGATVRFTAISNRTYTVQFSDNLGAVWQKFADVLARMNSRVELLIDPKPGSNRYYRLVTPIQP